MTRRLDQERERKLQPQRIKSTIEALAREGVEASQFSELEVRFQWKGETVYVFPYSGWW